MKNIDGDAANMGGYATQKATIKIKGAPKPVKFSSIAYDASANGRPTVTFDTTSNNAAPSGMSYKIGADGTWKSLTNNEGTGKTSGTTTGTTWTVGDEVFNALIAGTEVKVSSDEGATDANTLTLKVGLTTAGQNVGVKQATAPTDGTNVTIDYSAAQLTATAKSGYEILDTADSTYKAGPVNVTAGTAFKYRAKGTAAGIPSADVEVTPASNGTIKAINTTDWTDMVDGKTTVGAATGADAANTVKTGDKYIVKDSEPAASEWSTADSIDTLPKPIANAKEGDKIWFYRAGTSGTPGASGSVDAVGYKTAGEISMSAPTAVSGATAKAVLTIANDKGKFADASKITVTKASSSVGTASATLSASTSEPTHTAVVATIENSADWEKDVEYTVTVATDAVTPNLTAAKTFKFKIEDKGYKLVPVTTEPTKDLTISYSPAQLVPSGTIDVTITGVPTGKEIDTVTAGGTALTKKSDGVYTYTAPSTPATKVENVDLVVTLKDKTYAALEYTVADKYPVDRAISITPKAVDPDLKNLTATVTGDDATNSNIEVNKTTGEITAAADSLKPGATYTVVITDGTITGLPATTVTIKVGNAGATPVIADKYYDGTTDVDETKITFKDKGGTTLSNIELDGEATYASADVGNTVGVTFSAGASLKGTGATGYDLVTSGITGKILADTIASATVKDGVSCPADMDDLYDAIQGATVTVTTTNGKKEIELGTLMSAISDDDLKTIIDTALSAGGFESDDPDNPGTKIPDITAMSSGDTLNLTIPNGKLTALDSTMQKNLGATMTDVTFTYTVKKKPVVNPGTSTVIVEDRGFGVASTTEVVVDENGKIVELPTVSDVVKGAAFKGWSTDGTKNHIIDIDTYVVKEGEELTLTAVYEGYMAGSAQENGTVIADASSNVTRGQLARMLVVASGQFDPDADKNKKPTFSDSQTGWFTPYVAVAEELGILHGDGNTENTVRPNDPVTRQEASIMIATAFGVVPTDGETTDKVIDFDKVPDWAQKYVAALCNNGTINGYEDKTFRGEGNITRAESSQMINMYLGLTEADKEAIKNDDSIVSPFPDVKEKDWTYANIMFASLSVPVTYYSTEITIPEAK